MRSPTLLLAILVATPLNAATLTVDTTSNVALSACSAAPGDCSLRGALGRSNLDPGTDNIEFDIPLGEPGCVAATGVCVLQVGGGFPAVFGGGPVIIDGTTQPGAQPNTRTPAQGGLDTRVKIELDGRGCVGCNGLYLASNGSLVRGVAVYGFNNDVKVEGFGVVVEGCFIGTDATGAAVPEPRGIHGVVLNGNPFSGEAFSGVRIGGTLPAQRNLISGHAGEGVMLLGYGISVLGNLIGTDAAGTAALGNRNGVFAEGGGISGQSFQYLVGDGSAGGRNVISGNGEDGVFFSSVRSVPTRDSRIQGNYIGTDVGGELPLGNGRAGVHQELTVPDGEPGVSVEIGGVVAGQGNRIRFNATQGILVRRAKNAVRGNQVDGNAALGIGLFSAVRNVNDPGDGDTGANNVQNFPQVGAFATNGATFDVSYLVDSAIASSAYPMRVEFFKADRDEGRDFLGADNYLAADAQTVKAVSLSVAAGVTVDADDVIVATATDAAGNTSEFTFYPATLAIQAPAPSACTGADGIFCTGFDIAALPSLSVRVVAVAASGPFAPNGVVSIGDDRGASCSATLAPTATPQTSAGSCILVSSGTAGPITITATLDALRSAFAAASGGNATAVANFTVQ